MSDLQVIRMGQHGDGVALSGAQKLHVPKVLPGETVRLGAQGLAQVVTPSVDRILPFCPVYDRCGGCKLQHWRHDPYAAWKKGLVEDALTAAGVLAEVEPLQDAHGKGRRRVSLHVRNVAGRWVAGFMEAKSHRLCAIDQCPILEPRLRHAPQLASDLGSVLGACDVAITAADNGLDVLVKAEGKALPPRLDRLCDIHERWGLARLAINGEAMFTAQQPVISMGRAQVALPVGSFLQATAHGEERLAQEVCNGLQGSRSVADLFCGVGTFALRLAERAQVHAFDSDKAAIHALQQAGRSIQGLKPIKAEVRNLFVAPLVAAELNDFDGVVFDPPRSGAEGQARKIAASRVKRVVAVSCDVRTFARDAAILAAGGFQPRRIVPIDQFKWTAHVEIAGVFVR